MTAVVTKHLHLVAGAPDGVKRLRALFLELAVSGQLVAQDPAEAHVELLLKAVNAVVFPDTASPFELPRGWAWTRFAHLLDFQGGGQPPKSEFLDFPQPGYVQLLQIRDLGEKPQPVFVRRDAVSKFCTSADILVGRYGASVGKVFWGRDGAYNVALVKMIDRHGMFDNRFLHLLLSSPLGQSYFSGISRSAQDGFNKGDIADRPLPVCSVAEQRRIVAKVDELMVLCDRLEADQADAEAAHAQLVQALLGRLTQATDAADFRASWQRLSEHFHTLFTTDASIARLREVILHLAADGRLMASDGPVEFRAIGDVLHGNTLNGCSHKPTDAQVGTPILRISAGTGSDDFYVDEADHKWVELTGSELEKFRLEPNDLLACRFNGNLHYVGSFSLYRGVTDRVQVFPDKLIRFRANSAIVLPHYLRLMMNAKPAREQIESFCATTVGNIGISATNLKTVLVRLPTLAEQHRTVAKVDELMTLCDQLKAQLRQARQQHAQLARVLVEQAVAA
jgi:type I restriction enzyme S subunit